MTGKRPLWKKLGIKPSFNVSAFSAPDHIESLLEGLPDSAALNLEVWAETTNIAIMFCRDQLTMVDQFVFHESLPQNGAIWIAWPKKSSGKQTDLGDAAVRQYGLDLGLVDNKVCSIDETWSGLRFTIPVKDRT